MESEDYAHWAFRRWPFPFMSSIRSENWPNSTNIWTILEFPFLFCNVNNIIYTTISPLMICYISLLHAAWYTYRFINQYKLFILMWNYMLYMIYCKCRYLSYFWLKISYITNDDIRTITLEDLKRIDICSIFLWSSMVLSLLKAFRSLQVNQNLYHILYKLYITE